MSISEIGAVIICDDVRRELNGKDILIGVYSGSIVITSFPFQLILALWVEFLPTKIGKTTLHFRMSYKTNVLGTLKIDIDVTAIDSVAVPITGLAVIGDSEGKLVLEYSDDGIVWKIIKEKAIARATGSILSFAAAASPKSEN